MSEVVLRVNKETNRLELLDDGSVIDDKSDVIEIVEQMYNNSSDDTTKTILKGYVDFLNGKEFSI